VKQGDTTEYLGVYEKSTINTRNVESFHIHDMFANYLGSR
jgi:GTP cyclohydrolase FolE2